MDGPIVDQDPKGNRGMLLGQPGLCSEVQNSQQRGRQQASSPDWTSLWMRFHEARADKDVSVLEQLARFGRR